MGQKPRIFDDESDNSSSVGASNSTLGLDMFNLPSASPPVNQAMEEKTAVFVSALKPQVFGSLPASIGSFMSKYQEYLNIFSHTISDETQRRETAILMARKDVPVNAEVLDEAESSFQNALRDGATSFKEAIQGKANKTIGQAKNRSEKITERRNQIRQQIAQLQSEDNGLANEFEQLKTTAITVQDELTFTNNAFSAAYAAVEAEGENLLRDLKRMLKQEEN